MSSPLPAILLAAGGSTRMGRTKQLLPYRGRTLVWQAANSLLAAGFTPLLVVVGHDAEAVTETLADLPVTFVHNAHWQLGIGSSIREGIAHLVRLQACDGVLIALADQPGVSAQHLTRLRETWKPGRICASAYASTAAVPAIFPASAFDELLKIDDNAGAKPVLMRHAAIVDHVPLDDARDIDRPDDYGRLSAERSSTPPEPRPPAE